MIRLILHRTLFATIGLLSFLASPSFATEVALDKKGKWEVLKYSSIKPNDISFSESGMNLKIDNSASPVIYPLSEPTRVSKIVAKGRIDGQIDFGERKQGEKKADDFQFRIGLVFEGDETLGFFKRQIAADWVKRLFSLAPDGTGVDRIQFFNIVQDESLIGKSRKHPLSDLIEERFVAAKSEDGSFIVEVDNLDKSKVLALWLSSDGDDTGAKYTVILEKIEILSPSN